MVGGTTYEEARTVAVLNQEPAAMPPGSSTTSPRGTPAPSSGTRILLGGTCIHNSSRHVLAKSL